MLLYRIILRPGVVDGLQIRNHWFIIIAERIVMIFSRLRRGTRGDNLDILIFIERKVETV